MILQLPGLLAPREAAHYVAELAFQRRPGATFLVFHLFLSECQMGRMTPTVYILFFFFFAFRAASAAYGGSPARGPTGAAAAGLHHSHSNARSEPRPQPTPQLMATPDP